MPIQEEFPDCRRRVKVSGRDEIRSFMVEGASAAWQRILFRISSSFFLGQLMSAIEFVRLEPMAEAQNNLHMTSGLQKNNVHEQKGSTS